MKIGICASSFPQGMGPLEMLAAAKSAGFDGIEPSFKDEGPVSLKASRDDMLRFRQAADKAGLEIPSVGGGLYWATPFTSDDPDVRSRALEIGKAHLRAAQVLGADTVLIVPAVVHAFFIENCPVVRYDRAYERAISAMKELASLAEDLGVHIGVENVWNKFLMTPLEMARFIDEVGSSHVGCYLDVGNVIPFGFPQDWVAVIGKRIRKVHVKDFKADASIQSMAGFVDIFQGDVEWPAVIAALRGIGYDDYLTAEMIPLYRHCPVQRVHNTAASLRAILGENQGVRK